MPQSTSSIGESKTGPTGEEAGWVVFGPHLDLRGLYGLRGVGSGQDSVPHPLGAEASHPDFYAGLRGLAPHPSLLGLSALSKISFVE